METVYKYEIPSRVSFELVLPEGATPLYVALKDKKYWMWCLVDTGRKSEVRQFEIAGTGVSIDGILKRYIGTIIDDDCVFHFFEVYKNEHDVMLQSKDGKN